tara:strand:+ start:56786 stop:56917 length:132 start_codon:yes stop_codon:yes gene_type:complete
MGAMPLAENYTPSATAAARTIVPGGFPNETVHVPLTTKTESRR